MTLVEWVEWIYYPHVYFVLSEQENGCGLTVVLNLLLYWRQQHLIRKGDVHVSVIYADQGPKWLQTFYNDHIGLIMKAVHFTARGTTVRNMRTYLKQHGAVRYCMPTRTRKHLRNGEPMIVAEPHHLVLMAKINGRYHRLDRYIRNSKGSLVMPLHGKYYGVHFIEKMNMVEC